MPTIEPGLIIYIKMNSFTFQYLIPHYHTKIRFSSIMQISRLTSKLVFLMEHILNMQVVTRVIQIIYLGMKIYMGMNLNTTFQI